MQFRLPNADTVLEIHTVVVETFGGLSGVPNPIYIEQAILRPQNYMTYVPTCDIHLVAAIILDSIARYHAFADGNKRTALVTMIYTYRLNNVVLSYGLLVNNRLEKLVLDVADNKKSLTIKQIRRRLIAIVERYAE
jgi:death-on-curing protein